MLIDWFTVAAQAINFLVLVALLKWLLYDRIIKAMDQRQADIADRFALAEEEKQTAIQEREGLSKDRQELEKSRERRISEAREQAQEEKNRMLEKARNEVEKNANSWRQALEREKSELARRLAFVAAGQVMEVGRRALSNLTGKGHLGDSVDVFLERLASMDKENKKKVSDTIGANTVTITSSQELSSADRSRLTRTVHNFLAQENDVKYAIDPELVLGLELSSQGMRLAWNARDYLESIERAILDVLDRQDAKQEESHEIEHSDHKESHDPAEPVQESGQDGA